MDPLGCSSFVIDSSGHTGVNYRVFVSTPDHPAPVGAPARVIYTLDGNWLFPIVAAYVNTLRLFEPGFQNTVVVGVGYDTYDDSVISQLRVSDLAPLRSNPEGVARFRDFIANRVRSELSVRYTISQGRHILAGHSWGGAFSLFTLLTTPEAFDGYLSVSPPVYESVLPDIEEHFFQKSREMSSQLLLCVGGGEGSLLSEGLEFSRRLEGRAYKDFSFASHVFQDENHASVIMPAIARGLRELFK